MLLKTLCSSIQYIKIQGDDQMDIIGLSNDSRKMIYGGLFFAIKGTLNDGNAFIKQVIDKGAIAIVSSEPCVTLPSNVTYIQVEDVRIAQALMVNQFYQNKIEHMKLIGVTGTHGKTTTSSFFYDILNQVSGPAGLIGAINNKAGYRIYPSLNATPDILDCYELISEVNLMRGKFVSMEVSAVGLARGRVEGLAFEVAVFTNMSYTEENSMSFEDYRCAKESIFKQAKQCLINIDDLTGQYFYNRINDKPKFSYSIYSDADFVARNIQLTMNGSSFIVEHKGINYNASVRTPGIYGIYNALATIGTLYLLGFDIEKTIHLLERLNSVSGRFESVNSSRGYTVVIDYARTPEGLANLYKTIATIPHQNVITVFGCTGDKDQVKRFGMGQTAGRFSDSIIITSDNPRDEDPEMIYKDIALGIEKTHAHFEYIKDRSEAIEKALMVAKTGDIVLIAGKGHENFQILSDGIKVSFDDKKQVERCIAKEQIE